MMARAKTIVAINAFPAALHNITEKINKLAKKGVEVYVQAYAPIVLDRKVPLIIPDINNYSLHYWQAEQLNIAVDRKEVLVALFNKDLDKLIHATYSNNIYLSCIMYSGISSEQ